MIRVKNVRDCLDDISDLLRQAFDGLNVSPDFFDKYTVSNSEISLIHGKMICDEKYIGLTANTLFNKKWFLCINKTNKFFYTSDNPIGTIAHAHHPYMPMNGLSSNGVEVYFPVSPNLILLMFDTSVLPNDKLDRRVISIETDEDIDFYNSQIVINSRRIILSKSPDFDLISKMVSIKDDILDAPKSVLHWGNKTFYPHKK